VEPLVGVGSGRKTRLTTIIALITETRYFFTRRARMLQNFFHNCRPATEYFLFFFGLSE
jgi:hypothetical protein